MLATITPIRDVAPLLSAITVLSALHRNPDSEAQRAAVEAEQQGRAAYWSTATYHNQLACIMLVLANKRGVGAALAHCADDAHRNEARHSWFLLDSLIPLNPAAVAELAAARSRLWQTKAAG